MPVPRPRTRLVNFRVNDEEYATLRTACTQNGARSISDFARLAVLGRAGVDRAPGHLHAVAPVGPGPQDVGTGVPCVQLLRLLEGRGLPEQPGSAGANRTPPLRRHENGEPSRMKPILPIIFLILAAGVAAAQAASRRAAEPAGANLPALRIGPNDLIAVSVYDSPELTRTVRVGPDGMIRLPMLKQRIKADGLLPVELEAAIAEALRAEQMLVDPVVTVTIAEYHSRPISVAGAVRNPVTFQAAGPVTLLDALTRAGGLSPEAGPEILVSRMQAGEDGEPTALVQRIPVKALIDAADPEMNLKLTGGEEIRVPEVGKVYVVGTVRKPGAFPVQNSSETTVLQMLALAEGLAPFASKQAYIYRQDACHRLQARDPDRAEQDPRPQGAATCRCSPTTSCTSRTTPGRRLTVERAREDRRFRQRPPLPAC